MNITIGGQEFNLDTRLRVCYELQKQFNKKYMEIFKSISTMGIEEQIKMLYCGLSKEDKEKTSLTSFVDLLLDNIGLDEMLDHITKFVNQIQYPGLTEEEIEKKVQEKQAKLNKMKMTGLED